jgi:hypothetical protein
VSGNPQTSGIVTSVNSESGDQGVGTP